MFANNMLEDLFKYNPAIIFSGSAPDTNKLFIYDFVSLAVPVNVHDMRKFIEDALTKDGKEDGYTLEEIERNIRCDHQEDFDPKTDLSVQLKLALKRGTLKGRYIKQGRFYRMSPKTTKSPKVYCR